MGSTLVLLEGKCTCDQMRCLVIVKTKCLLKAVEFPGMEFKWWPCKVMEKQCTWQKDILKIEKRNGRVRNRHTLYALYCWKNTLHKRLFWYCCENNCLTSVMENGKGLGKSCYILASYILVLFLICTFAQIKFCTVIITLKTHNDSLLRRSKPGYYMEETSITCKSAPKGNRFIGLISLTCLYLQNFIVFFCLTFFSDDQPSMQKPLNLLKWAQNKRFLLQESKW